MTSDLQLMYALTFRSVLILLYHTASRLVFTRLYCYTILSSADCLYIIIYIGHIADGSKPYRYRLVSASAGTTPSACPPIGLHILSVAGSNWLARPHLTKIWTATGAKKISHAVVFVDLVRANTVLAPLAKRGFFVNTVIPPSAASDRAPSSQTDFGSHSKGYSTGQNHLRLPKMCPLVSLFETWENSLHLARQAYQMHLHAYELIWPKIIDMLAS